MKINTDGSVISANGSTACGGLIRDHMGRFITGFSMNLGDCTITLAKLWAVDWGFTLGLQMSLNQVIL